MESNDFVMTASIYVTIAVCEVLTGVIMKSTIFLDVMPCVAVNAYQCFGGPYCLHLQDEKSKPSKKPIIAASFYTL
jgi:hypothetical protein